jgi:hypothetical protein
MPLGGRGQEPRTLWACQSVWVMISARVAPLARPSISIIFAPLRCGRAALSSSVTPRLALFRAHLAACFGMPLVLAPFSAVRALGASFFRVAPFFRGGVPRRAVRAVFRNGGALRRLGSNGNTTSSDPTVGDDIPFFSIVKIKAPKTSDPQPADRLVSQIRSTDCSD